MKTIQIIVGSNRPNRVGRRVADWLLSEASQDSELRFELLDLAEINLPFMNEPKLPAEGDYQQEHTKAWSETITRGDGYIIVMPEYNHGYSAVLKNALDTLYPEWAGKPVSLVAYSNGFGAGFRATEQLLPVLHTLGMVVQRAKVNIPSVNLQDGQAFTPIDPTVKAAKAMLAELKTALA